MSKAPEFASSCHMREPTPAQIRAPLGTKPVPDKQNIYIPAEKEILRVTLVSENGV